jgi:hypothetical protein
VSECHPPTARIHLLLSSRDTEVGPRPRHRQSRVISGLTVMPKIPYKPGDGQTASTATTTATRAMTITVDAADATTATTTVSTISHQASVDQGPLIGASATRSIPRTSGPRPMCQDTTGTPFPAYGSRTTDLRAMPGERLTISS